MTLIQAIDETAPPEDVTIPSGLLTLVEPDTDPAPTPADISIDEVFFTLSNTRRRYVLHHLLQRRKPIELRELATRVAAWENGVAPEVTTRTQRKRAYVSLRQNHLPKMDELGIVEFDAIRGLVAVRPEVTSLSIGLEGTDPADGRWSELYLGLASLGAVALALGWFGLVPFGLGSGFAVAGLLVASFFLVALLHVLQ